jgi:hypothetical protein
MRRPAAYSGNLLLANLLGVAIAALTGAALTRTSLAVLVSDRAIFLVLAA